MSRRRRKSTSRKFNPVVPYTKEEIEFIKNECANLKAGAEALAGVEFFEGGDGHGDAPCQRDECPAEGDAAEDHKDLDDELHGVVLLCGRLNGTAALDADNCVVEHFSSAVCTIFHKYPPVDKTIIGVLSNYV